MVSKAEKRKKEHLGHMKQMPTKVVSIRHRCLALISASNCLLKAS